jgi:hypothetical protein
MRIYTFLINTLASPNSELTGQRVQLLQLLVAFESMQRGTLRAVYGALLAWNRNQLK